MEHGKAALVNGAGSEIDRAMALPLAEPVPMDAQGTGQRISSIVGTRGHRSNANQLEYSRQENPHANK